MINLMLPKKIDLNVNDSKKLMALAAACDRELKKMRKYAASLPSVDGIKTSDKQIRKFEDNICILTNKLTEIGGAITSATYMSALGCIFMDDLGRDSRGLEYTLKGLELLERATDLGIDDIGLIILSRSLLSSLADSLQKFDMDFDLKSVQMLNTKLEECKSTLKTARRQR